MTPKVVTGLCKDAGLFIMAIDINSRIRRFTSAASSYPLQTNVYISDRHKEKQRAFVKSVLAYSCLVASGAALIAYVCASDGIAPTSFPYNPVAQAATSTPEDKGLYDLEDHYLSSKLKFVEVNLNGQKVLTPDLASRLLLVKAAYTKEGLSKVGLKWSDLYGIIHAETSWYARKGMGANNVPSYGLAQFEPGTAKDMGLNDPGDPVQAVRAAARLMKMAASTAVEKFKINDFRSGDSHATIMRWVSMQYNMGKRGAMTRGHKPLPAATVIHIKNVAEGALFSVDADAAFKIGTVMHLQENRDFPALKTITNDGLKPASFEKWSPAQAAKMNDQFIRANADLKGLSNTSDPMRGVQGSGTASSMPTQYKHLEKITRSGNHGRQTRVAGVIEGIPIVLYEDPYQGISFGRLKLSEKHSQPVIFISSAMVDNTKGPQRQQVLEFILNRELGHIKLGHIADKDGIQGRAGNLKAQKEADLFALNILRHHSVDSRNIHQIVGAFLHKIEQLDDHNAIDIASTQRRQALAIEINRPPARFASTLIPKPQSGDQMARATI